MFYPGKVGFGSELWSRASQTRLADCRLLTGRPPVCSNPEPHQETDEFHRGARNRIYGAGRTCCKGKCVKLNTDGHNCGRCGRRYRNNEQCVNGTRR